MFKLKIDGTAPNARTLSIDYRIVSLLLLVALAVCVFLWKPWAGGTAATRKITITGQATVKGVPDEYRLNPYFEFTGDHTKATAEAAAMAAQVTAKLKELGVKDTEISSNTSSYDKYVPLSADGSTQDNMQLSYTITLTSKDTAQKVQDYFLGTAAKGQLSPQATFSQTKQKELEAQARQNAIDDAKSKAAKSAAQVDAKLGKVVTIKDQGTSGGCGANSICPLSMSIAADSAEAARSSIPVQSGQNEFTSSVQVEYELR
jgi:uncharacterized protein YggE